MAKNKQSVPPASVAPAQPAPAGGPPLPPPHPPQQAKASPKRRPSPHLKHDQLIKRPGEKMHIAKHALLPHQQQPKLPQK